MNKRFFSIILCTLLVFATVAASAASFPDVDKTKYSWAYSQIQDMASKKIIAGFEDGTFRPENSVTRIDALLLISRIAGASESSLSDFVNAAYDANYADVNVLGYSAYEKNLSYLLYKGIYTPTELRTFVGNKAGSNALKRYEAAILLTKITGQEATVKANTMPVLSYEDSSSIPANAKSYVEFCETSGLMQGMEDNKFNPNFEVTRAQMAVMLYRAMDYMNTEHSTGTVTSINQITNSVTYTNNSGASKTVNVLTDTLLRLDGEQISDLKDIETGYKINVVTNNTNVSMIEFVTKVADKEISGIYSGATTTTTLQKISVKEIDGSETHSIPLADDCVITINGSASTFSSLQKNSFVSVTVSGGKAVMIAAESSTKTISGVLKAVTYGNPAKLTVTLSNNTTQTFDMSDDVTVTRNSRPADANELKVGDKISIKLVYNQISTITATSSTTTIEGTIEEIVISATPSIKINTSSGILDCALDANGLTVTVNGEKSDVYGLRIGYIATVKMESTTITDISVSSVATSETVNIVGVVEYVDTNYYLIQLNETSSGQSKQVFVKKSATIIDGNTQKSKTLSSIKEGDLITAVVSSNGFTSEAISIVILPN